MRIVKDYEKLSAMEMYFLYLDEEKFIKALECYSKKKGYSITEFIICAFSTEYEVGEVGYFGKEGVKFEVEPPAVDKEMFEVVSESEFIKCLGEIVESYVYQFPTDEVMARKLYEEINKK